MKNKHAFTLIELLVVIAIIGVLAAILIPVLSGVREGAFSLRCQGNLKSLGQAANAYAGDENERLLWHQRSALSEDAPKAADIPNFFAGELGPHLDLRPAGSSRFVTMNQIGKAKFLDCPTSIRNNEPVTNNKRRCFGINIFLDRNNDNLVYLGEIDIPTQTLYFADSQRFPSTWALQLTTTSRVRHEHKRKSANMLFIDGHTGNFGTGGYPTSTTDTQLWEKTHLTGVTFWTGLEVL